MRMIDYINYEELTNDLETEMGKAATALDVALDPMQPKDDRLRTLKESMHGLGDLLTFLLELRQYMESTPENIPGEKTV